MKRKKKLYNFLQMNNVIEYFFTYINLRFKVLTNSLNNKVKLDEKNITKLNSKYENLFINKLILNINL